jgi:ribosomal-protein-alanine N-acetyltransferase
MNSGSSHIPILETTRLRLRPLAITDAPRIQELVAVWDVVQYLDAQIPWPYPEDGAEHFLSRKLPEMSAGSVYTWALTLKSENDDLLIGVIELMPSNPKDSRAFWIGVPYQQRGYMTEAVCAVNDFAFDTLGMDRLLLNNAVPNIGSHKLKEKSGATIVDDTEDYKYVAGTYKQISWVLTKAQWQANREGFCGS